MNRVSEYKILIGTHHKTGTVWLEHIFRAIGGRFRLRYVASGHQSPKPVGHWDIFHNKHSQFDLDALGDFRGLHMIRDPRDQIVSATHYHLKAKETWLHVPRPSFGGLSYQQKINSLPTLEDQLLFEMSNAASFDIGHMRAFDYSDPRFLTIKYEDYVTDYSLVRFEQAFRFLEFSETVIGWCLVLALRNSLFSGSIRTTGHIRSGKPKQWPAFFTPKLKAAFHERFGDILTTLGYEEGDEWSAL